MPFAAAVFRAGKIEILAQHAQEAALGARVHAVRTAVDVEFQILPHTPIIGERRGLNRSSRGAETHAPGYRFALRREFSENVQGRIR